nr:hypothetical protein [Rhodococcus sp. 15-649-1-2]
MRSRKSLSELASIARSALIGFGSTIFAGLTTYGEYHLGAH